MKTKLYGKLIAEGRWSAESGQVQNLPRQCLPRQIPVLNRTGRVVAQCQAPKVYSYG